MPFAPRSALLVLASAVAAASLGCAGVSPDPQQMARALPPPAAGTVDRDAFARDLAAALGRYEAGDIGAAGALAERLMTIDPRSGAARALFAMGLADAARRQVPPELATWRRAEGEILRAAAVDPGDPLVARLHADFLVLDEHRTAAAAVLDAALELHPEDPDLLRRAARVHFDLGDELAAIELAGRRLAVAPGDADAAWQLAESALRLADQAPEDDERIRHAEAAVGAFATYRALRPDDVDGAIGEASARHALFVARDATVPEAELEPLLAAWNDVERMQPGLPAARVGRGAAFELAGRADLAEIAYRRALERDERHLPALLNLAALLAANGREPEAAPLLRRALTITSDADEREQISAWLAGHGDR